MNHAHGELKVHIEAGSTPEEAAQQIAANMVMIAIELSHSVGVHPDDTLLEIMNMITALWKEEADAAKGTKQ